MDKPITCVYLMGHGFSGSTLLTLLLNAHPGIATVGEMGIAPRSIDDPTLFACSCGQLINVCTFWRRVTALMAARGYEFDITRGDLLFQYSTRLSDRLLATRTRGPLFEAFRSAALSLEPAARRHRRDLLERIATFIDVVTSMKGCRVFLDSTKRPERALQLRRMSSLDLKIVHLVRDGRAVTYSCMKNLGVGIEEATRSWHDDLLAIAHTRRQLRSTPWLTVRYEDLCSAPERTVDRIVRFAGLRSNHLRDFRIDHHVIGNRMRLDGTREIRLDDRWRNELTPVDLRRIDSLIGRLNAEYGYAST